nr:unnamed protein product [Digitaria exilis]
MCDYFLQRMDGDQAAGAGDLTDIVRAGGGAMPGNAELPSTATEWQLHHGEQTTLFPPPPPLSSSDGCTGAGADVFGDPFSGLGGDPFNSDYASVGGGVDFLDAMPDAMAKVAFDTAITGGGGGGGQLMMDMSRKQPILPRGVQTTMASSVGMLAPASRVMPSPLSPRAIRPYPAMAMAGDMVKLGITAGQVAGCAIDAAVVGMQMSSSSPRGAGGIKRRKNQARKVVCIPAPTAAGGRPTGEVVPSDLWAWRKYGQKPIKGSPYPSSSSGSKSSQNEKQQQTNVKEEPKDPATTATTSTVTTTTTTSTSPAAAAVKEETLPGSSEGLGRAMDAAVVDHNNIELMDQVFSESYKPMIPEAGQSDDFFSDLAELESDPMSLIFSKEYMEAKPSGGDRAAQEKAITKDLDPFDILDWSTTSSAGSSFEQGKRG